jgi:hypothetical protein
VLDLSVLLILSLNMLLSSCALRRRALGFVSLVLLALGWLWESPAIAHAQTQNGIIEPASQEEVSGIVIVRGTAVHPDFLRYELAFFQVFNPGADWIVFAQSDQSVVDNTLAVWDTTVGQETVPIFPDGLYRLRLRVVRTDYNYDEYFVTELLINNGSLTPSPTPTMTITTEIATGTPVPGSLIGTQQPNTGVLPSLTPFPTPTPLATLASSILGPPSTNEDSNLESPYGLLTRLTGIDTEQFGRAFWQGVEIVGYAFVALAAYLLLRGIFRRLWRSLQSKIFR